MFTPKRVVLSLLLMAWLGVGAYFGHQIAGGAALLIHKKDPTTARDDTWESYWQTYQDDPNKRKQLKVAAAVPFLLFLGVPLILLLASLHTRRSLHGDARWATQGEARAAGLLADNGIILGKWGGKFLMNNAAKFLLLIAPTRSGKGVGIIIPNLLNWTDSCVISDIKGENFAVTSGFRAAHGQAVYKFAPFDPLFETHRWNPLTYVDRDPRFIVGDLQSIGYMLYPKREGGESFWNDQARNLFVGVALYCVESGWRLSIGEVLRQAAGGGRPKEFWEQIVLTRRSANGKPLSLDCVSALRQFSGNSENTLTSIFASFNAPLGVFSNPLVDAATSGDDFDVRDIFKRKMTIYLVIPPNKLAESSLLMNLFFSLTYDQNTKILPEQDPSLKYKCLMVQDEFPALGRIDKFVRAVGYLAGYGFRCITVAQSVSQLQARDLYGQEGARTLVSNHMLQVLFAPREQADAKEYSEILGYSTEEAMSKGRAYSRGSPSSSENISQQRRALMLPQELREIGEQREIIISDNCKPLFVDKIKYYADPACIPRLLKPVKVAAIDLDAFLRARDAAGAAVTPLSPAAPAAAANETMPEITSSADNVLDSEVTAVANWLFLNIEWA